MWPRPIIDGALSGPPEKVAPNAHYPQSVSSHWEGNDYPARSLPTPGFPLAQGEAMDPNPRYTATPPPLVPPAALYALGLILACMSN